MRVASTRAEIGGKDGSRGFVPTMGALHQGHLDLVHRSAEDNDQTVVSIFVNPTQFGPNEDFTRYPRTLDQDLELAEAAGADIVYVPSVDEIYGENSISLNVSGTVNELWEANIRPGHFAGVATVVAKLFGIVAPDRAYFGQKDLQQTAVVRSLISELFLPLSLIVCPTTREPDGLAMSSRNRYLDTDQRLRSVQIFRELTICEERIKTGEPIDECVALARETLESISDGVDYFAAVELSGLKPVNYQKYRGDSLAIITAVRFGTTRLLDNVVL